MINIPQKSNWLKEQSKVSKDIIAINHNEIKLTYRQLDLFVDVFTDILKVQIKKNDFVLIQLENSIDFVCTILSLWNIGCVPIVVDPNYKQNEVDEIITATGQKVICLPKYIFLTALNKFFSLKFERLKCVDSKFYLSKNAIVLFTSGTVGLPKAVLISFDNLYHSAIATNSLINTQQKNKWLATLPFFHIGGFSIIARSLLSGCTLFIPSSLNTDVIISSIQSFSPDYISLVPTQVSRLLERNFDFNPKLKRVFIGGNKVNPDVAKGLVEKNIPVSVVYGSTETCSMVTALSDKEILNFPNSVGKPLGNTQIKIIDSNGNELKENKEGLIFVEGPTVAEGYLKKKFQKFNGKYLTKDFGYLDLEKNLFVVGRSDGIIISGGKKIDPKKIEEILINNSKIKDCAVVGVEDDVWGEKIVALIVKKENLSLGVEEVINYLKERFVAYKIPKEILFVDEVPKNMLGKKDTKKILSIISELSKV
ncbi:MAG: acyl--CoA ligase [Ignavibacteriales bacterium]|nr:acyl--CoA ligase [Ignavibacteriales bacterium]